jgi:hypothetical protein
VEPGQDASAALGAPGQLRLGLIDFHRRESWALFKENRIHAMNLYESQRE